MDRHPWHTGDAISLDSAVETGSAYGCFPFGLPQLLSVLGFEFGGGLGALRLVDVEVDLRISLLYPVDEVVCFLEVVKSVEEDHVHSGFRCEAVAE